MSRIPDIIKTVDPDRIRRDLFYLAHDPLPCRTLNYTIPGHDKCTLYEVDEFVRGVLAGMGYHVVEQGVPVQAFTPDATQPWGFRKPRPDDPWYLAQNIHVLKRGFDAPEEVVVILAHKDSQSWLQCGPGAYDNGVGVAALLEISRLVADIELRRSLMILFCNEEHWPWTSIHAAEQLAHSSFNPVAVLNLDSIGGKAQAEIDEGRLPNVVRCSTAEGEHLADLISETNLEYGVGLEVSKVWSTPNDDDGSFVIAGIAPAVLMIGSFPYADPNYHTIADTPDKVDIENVRRATQLALAATIALCGSSDPSG